MSRTARIRLLILPLLLLYFWAAVWMAFNLPAHATPNELLNYEYVAVMRQIRALPNRGLVDSEIRYTEWHQPPVFFTLAALVGLPIPVPRSPVNPPPPIEVETNPHYLSTPRGNLNPVVHITPHSTPLLYTSRLAAALLGLLGVAALYRAGSQLIAPSAGLLMASLMAFQPGYVHLSGSVNNDMPLTAVVAIVMAYSLLLLTRQERRPDDPPRPLAYFLLGLLGVAAILTKANGVFVLAFLAVVLLSSFLIYRRLGLTVRYGLAMLAGLVPLWAAWLVLNSIRMRDALGLEGSLPVGQVLTLSPLDFVHLGPWLATIWRSYWLDWSAGDVGYGPDWLYLFWLVAVVGMLLGWLVPQRIAAKRAEPRRWSLVTPLVLLGFLGISYLYFAVKALTVREAGFLVPEARWWLPGLPALAWLAAAGFARWWPAPRRDAACLLAAAVPPLILLGLILFHFPYLYPQAQPVEGSDPAGALDSPLVYDSGLSLLGLEAGEAPPGEPLPLTLTWRADRALDSDLTIATQLLALAPEGWLKLGETNTYPGQGRSPTRGWPAGWTVRDETTILTDADLNGPVEAAIQVQVLDGDAVATASRDRQPVDPPLAGTVVLRPSAPLEPPAPLNEPVSYGNGIRLRQATVDRDGGAPVVTLWWEAVGEIGADYTVFVHLLDEAGQLVAQADGPPNNGLSPSRIWQAGDTIRDIRRFAPGVVAKPGWTVLIGWYDPASGDRLPAQQAGNPLPGQALAISVE